MSFSKEIWGNNIWYLFHSLAHKIREEKFEVHKNNLIFIIKFKASSMFFFQRITIKYRIL